MVQVVYPGPCIVYILPDQMALAAQQVIWVVVHLFRTRLPPFPGSFNLGISCCCSDHCDCGENDAEGYIDDFLAF